MSGGTNDDHNQPLAEINVTPLVDIMLVLLVIFILIAPMITNALQIELPHAQAEPLQEPQVMDLTIMPEGQLLLDGARIERPQLVTRLRQRLANTPTLVLRLNADGMTHYQEVAQLMGELKQAGITRLAFAVQAL